MIKLQVSQPTFEKYILSLGYNYKILFFDNFIEKIQKHVFTLLKETSNLVYTSYEIFAKEPLLSVMFDSNNIKFVSDAFLTSMIEEGILDLYFEDKTIKHSLPVLKAAYKIKFLRENNCSNIDYFFQYDYLLDLNGSKNLKRLKAENVLKENIILEDLLTNEDIAECKKEVFTILFNTIYKNSEFDNFLGYLLMYSKDNFYSNISGIYTDMIINKIISKLIEDDIRLSGKPSFSKNIEMVNLLDELSEFIYNSYLFIFIANIYSTDGEVSYLRRNIDAYAKFNVKKNISKVIKKILDFDKSKLLDSSLSIGDFNISLDYFMEEN